jgi:hypothetical protein
MVLPLALTAALSSGFAVADMAQQDSRAARFQKVVFDGAVHYRPAAGAIPGLVVVAAHAAELGLRVQAADPGWVCDRRIGIVVVCRPPAASTAALAHPAGTPPQSARP